MKWHLRGKWSRLLTDGRQFISKAIRLFNKSQLKSANTAQKYPIPFYFELLTNYQVTLHFCNQLPFQFHDEIEDTQFELLICKFYL